MRLLHRDIQFDLSNLQISNSAFYYLQYYYYFFFVIIYIMPFL